VSGLLEKKLEKFDELLTSISKSLSDYVSSTQLDKQLDDLNGNNNKAVVKELQKLNKNIEKLLNKD